MLLLGLASLCAGLFWLISLQLITTIYHGNAGDLLNSLITGQATHSLKKYHADFNRLYTLACATILLPLLICSLLPVAVRRKIGRLPEILIRFTKNQLANVQHLPAPVKLLALLCAAATIVILSFWHAPVRIPDYYQPGHVTLLAGPEACDGHICYQLEVSCMELGSAEQVALRLGRSSEAEPDRGTILFFTGWTGTYWWQWDADSELADGSAISPEDLQIRASHRMIFDSLHAAGFLTVEIKWERGWFIADAGKRENPPLLACKPATVVDWVYKELHKAASDRAFCATGHSNGATELAYLLSRYDMDDILSLVIMEAGPNWARLDYACIPDHGHGELFDTNNGRNTNDLAYGYSNDGSGICARQDPDYLEDFRRTSVVVDAEWNYYYPETLVAFIFGSNDKTVTAHHGDYYQKWLSEAGSPLLRVVRIDGAGHVPSSNPAGASLMRDIFLNDCLPR